MHSYLFLDMLQKATGDDPGRKIKKQDVLEAIRHESERGFHKLMHDTQFAEFKRELLSLAAGSANLRAQPVRIVLLAREEGDWWRLSRRKQDEAEAIDNYLRRYQKATVRLAPMTSGVEERRAEFFRVREVFREWVDDLGIEPTTPAWLTTASGVVSL